MMKTMPPPMTRAEFERGFHILQEQMKKGKLHAVQGVTLGLDKVRFLPNGRLDFLSVNELARLHANTMAQFESGGAFSEMLDGLETEEGPK